MYKYIIVDGYIKGQLTIGTVDYPLYETEEDLNPLMLPTGEPRYKIVDDKLVETPFDWETYNLEQTKKQRDIKIVSAIREIYSQDDEYKLINLGIANSQDLKYLEYRKTVDKIKQEVTM